jgi:hypothetical protein
MEQLAHAWKTYWIFCSAAADALHARLIHRLFPRPGHDPLVQAVNDSGGTTPPVQVLQTLPS